MDGDTRKIVYQGQEVEVLECIPTPQGLVDMLLMIYSSTPNAKDKEYARSELIKAMNIAYAYWYPNDPNYHMEGVTGKPVN